MAREITIVISLNEEASDSCTHMDAMDVISQFVRVSPQADVCVVGDNATPLSFAQAE